MVEEVLRQGVSVAVELGKEGEFIIGGVVVLMTLDVLESDGVCEECSARLNFFEDVPFRIHGGVGVVVVVLAHGLDFL